MKNLSDLDVIHGLESQIFDSGLLQDWNNVNGSRITIGLSCILVSTNLVPVSSLFGVVKS